MFADDIPYLPLRRDAAIAYIFSCLPHDALSFSSSIFLRFAMMSRPRVIMLMPRCCLFYLRAFFRFFY